MPPLHRRPVSAINSQALWRPAVARGLWPRGPGVRPPGRRRRHAGRWRGCGHRRISRLQASEFFLVQLVGRTPRQLRSSAAMVRRHLAVGHMVSMAVARRHRRGALRHRGRCRHGGRGDCCRLRRRRDVDSARCLWTKAPLPRILRPSGRREGEGGNHRHAGQKMLHTVDPPLQPHSQGALSAPRPGGGFGGDVIRSRTLCAGHPS